MNERMESVFLNVEGGDGISGVHNNGLGGGKVLGVMVYGLYK